MRDKAFILQGQKMNFYKFIKQQYDDYYNKTILITCNGCPCKILRDKMINPNEQVECTSDITHLANKYNVHNFNVYSCDDCMDVSLEIAKKLFVKKEFNRI